MWKSHNTREKVCPDQYIQCNGHKLGQPNKKSLFKSILSVFRRIQYQSKYLIQLHFSLCLAQLSCSKADQSKTVEQDTVGRDETLLDFFSSWGSHVQWPNHLQFPHPGSFSGHHTLACPHWRFFHWQLKRPLQIFNGFWGDHHHWMFFGRSDHCHQWFYDGFLMLLPSLSMVFDGSWPLVKRCDGFDGSLWSTPHLASSSSLPNLSVIEAKSFPLFFKSDPRPQRSIKTIASFDQWSETIKNHRKRW